MIIAQSDRVPVVFPLYSVSRVKLIYRYFFHLFKKQQPTTAASSYPSGYARVAISARNLRACVAAG